jgi:TRAP-type C4-dicarboxylate transport system permease small subunit
MHQLVRLLNDGLKYVVIGLLWAMVIAVFLQVVFRFVLDQPLAWTEEVARYLLVWITFMGASYAMSQRAHIGVDVLVRLLPRAPQKTVHLLSVMISLVFFLVVVQQGYLLMQKTMTQVSSVLHIPMGWVYLAIPLSGIILSVNLIAITIEDWKKAGI